MQRSLFTDFTPQAKLRLSEIEEYLATTKALGKTPPSRQALINWVESGVLLGVKQPGLGWLVYEASFRRFLEGLEIKEAA